MSTKTNAVELAMIKKEELKTEGDVDPSGQEILPKGKISLKGKDFLLSANRIAGAFHYAEQSILTHKVTQYEMLITMKESGKWRELGYNNFTDFCSRELDIGHTKAHEILKIKKDIGKEFLIAGTKIGLPKSILKLLAKHKDQIEQDTTGETPIIKYKDKEIPVDFDHVKDLQQLAKDLEKSEKKVSELQDDVDKLQREITDLKEYEQAVFTVRTDITKQAHRLKALRERARNDKRMYNQFVNEMHYLSNWIYQLKTELLDEIQPDPDELEENDDIGMYN